MKDARAIPPLVVRLPDELKTWLKHTAIDNRRSLTSEIQIRLEQSRSQELIAKIQGATQ